MTDKEKPTGHVIPKVLILTPVKDAANYVERYFAGLRALTYPRELLSLGILEGDSRDGSFDIFRSACYKHEAQFRRVNVWQKNFGFHIPDGVPRWAAEIQLQRRAVLARSRNHLLFHALGDEEWVLWLDVDVIEFRADIIQKLLSYKRDIVHPNCVKQYGGKSFDLNAWRDHGRLHLHDLRSEGEVVPLDTVGGTMLLIRADCHRDGLVFPSFLYGKRNPKVRERSDIFLPDQEGEIETEGLGILAADMDLQCWGLPGVEIIHSKV
jgi:Anp1